MSKIIASLAFLIGFAIFMALKYIKRHAETGFKAAKAAAEAVDPTQLDTYAGEISDHVLDLAKGMKDGRRKG